MLQFNFQPFPELVTDRLILREVVHPDLDDFFNLRENEQVRRYIDRPKQTLQEVSEILTKSLAAVANNEAISWAITLKGQARLIGIMGFWRNEPEHHRGEIGYSLLPEYWQQGIASEAMKAVLNYGFETMRLHSVEANVNPENAASIRLLEKFGFVREAHFRENYYYEGRFLDSFIYSLLCSSFKS